MSLTGTTSAQIDIEVEGAPLDPLVYALLISAEVDTTMFVPSQFRLVFRGSSTTVLEGGGLQLGVTVLLQVTTGGLPTPLMTGDITGVEIDYGPEGRLTVVTGLDRSHRLMRGTKTMAYPEMTASDVIPMLLGECEVEPGPIDPTTTTYEWLTQANVSNWTFIQQLAALENRVAFVDRLGMFNFVKPPSPEFAGPPVMSLDEPPMGEQLAMGVNLIRLRSSVTSAEQVPEVNVTGYDPLVAAPVLGLAPSIPSTAMVLDPATEPALLAGEVGATPFFDASTPFEDEGAAENRAMSIAADLAAAMAEMEGECLGNPSIIAGKAFSIGMAGPPFDGQYICSSARHRFEPGNGGYSTWFTVGGMRDRSLFSLASGGGGADPVAAGRVNGLVIGKVMDNEDPESMGRVKVMFPWLSDEYLSAWARTMQFGASIAGGCLWLPEIDDEVLIGFDRGDVHYPYVIGNLYNGVNRPEPPPEVEGGVASRRLTSRMLHTVQFNDGPEAQGIVIRTGDETVSITLDGEQQALTIMSAGQVNIEAADAVSLKAAADFTIEAGGNVSIQAGGQVSVEGAAGISLESAASLALQGMDVSVEGTSVGVTAPEITLGA